MTSARIIDFPIRPFPCRANRQPRGSALALAGVSPLSPATAGLVPPSTSPAPSNPQPASAIDAIVNAWLATLSEEA